MDAIDPCRCPLCSHPNECGMVNGNGTCWCFSRPIPDHILERIPLEARDVACVCQACAFGHRSQTEAAEQLKEILRRRGSPGSSA